MIGIIDCGIGNLTSVRNALDYLGAKCEIFRRSEKIADYDKLILPGVGAFGQAMDNLKGLNFIDGIIKEVQEKKKPILGICLGMQLFYESSMEFGLQRGFGFIKGGVKSLREKSSELLVPHVGWNIVKSARGSRLFKDIEPEKAVFYFVHSYYCDAQDKGIVTGATDYGITFDAAIEKENIFGCQFHPEKSQKSGLALLKNFCEINA